MNRYESYKMTGVEWINKIPKTWEFRKINSIFDERREKVSDKDFEPLSVTKNGISKQLENVAKTNDGDNRKKVAINDFVINSRSDRKGSSGLSNFNGSVSLINTVLKIREDCPRYIHYLLKSVPFQEEFYRNGKGIVADLWSTNYQAMKNIVLPIPPLTEQEQIARYLDWKINEIDKLIEVEREKIEELGKLKSKFINSLFDSIDTETYSLKYLFSFGKGLSITKENLGKSGVKCISYGEIHNDFYFSFSSNNSKLKGLEKTEGVSLSKFAILNKGDFVFADTSEDLEGCGNFTYLEDDYQKVYAGYHTVVAKPKKKIESKYIAYYLQSNKWRSQIREIVKGIKVFSITQQILKNSKIQLVSEDLQKSIITKADYFCGTYNGLLLNSEKKIELLNSLKQSLISEVVTGKIDIRDVVIPDYVKKETTNDEINEPIEEID